MAALPAQQSFILAYFQAPACGQPQRTTITPLPSWPHHHQNFRPIAAISAFDRLPDFRNFFKDLMKTVAKNLSNPLLLGNNQDSNSGERTQMLTLS
ncbi:MAG: hypothetical protein VKL01_06405 [Limnothrix sp.]|uniref:hypothetical protein n=1 Tax=unclassified Limnothrix TaxID=2632864 RepID=UPI0016810968|nr:MULTISPECIES: hypothetical protein [unclassified Limnothrix]MEB3117979.1 hypothetical protein [Limnothrix sp.]MBD2160068.1 hypothetical protein [Limnothrix sp. FACHB-1083]MBD2190770.1 hypothetical protein [Limnothrix sp. FACHB-1088]MBD2553388.1 hypothetical protein [Limnothrix sp. FACHB-708]MBD2590429.1 hypothetical protein [Limnothrix sp. FACHB-406]